MAPVWDLAWCRRSGLQGKGKSRDPATGEAIMAPKRRIRKLAALVDTAPETLVQVIGDVLRDTVHELRTCQPRAGGHIMRNIRRHRQVNAARGRPHGGCHV